MQEHNGKMNPTDADTLSQLLEIQLAEKRSEWKRATSRYRAFRSIGFVFLFLVIAGALFAFFVFFSGVNEERPTHRTSTTLETAKP
jgi:hypothetical protein